MAATKQELDALHSLLARTLTKRISDDLEDNLPTDAATLGAAIKFLKDNAVTADPASSDDLTEMRDKLIEASKARKEQRSNVLSLVQEDLKQAQGG